VGVVAAHVLLYTPEAEALRTVLRETLGWRYVESNDPPDGWQIFALPPAEVGVHPSDGGTRHELCLMCDDLQQTIDELRAGGIELRGEPVHEPWGTFTTMILPGGVEVLLYERKHATPLDL
jgi:catechol 2,3-dioxygenase-like lactoylglutathione lyase family enzyme